MATGTEQLRVKYRQQMGLQSPYVRNKVPFLQKTFQAPDGLPVFLKGKYDARLYRGVMVFSLIGLGYAFFSIYQMATGSKQKKS